MQGLLAADFPPITFEQWRQRVEAELGGATFEKALTRATPEGLVRQPLYTSRDLAGKDPSGLPGAPPHTRGAQALRRDWAVAQEVRHAGEAVADGVGLVWLPDGPGELLNGIDLSRYEVVATGRDTDPSAPADRFDALLAEAVRQGVPLHELRANPGCDPLAALVAGWLEPGKLDQAFESAADLVARSGRETPKSRALVVDLAPLHDIGASAAQELAGLAASGVEMLRRLSRHGVVVDDVAGQVLFALDVGDDFFLEVAKLRAARLLWSKLIQACEGSDSARKMRLHARTSPVTRTLRDPWVNLLRSTSQSFAAAIGGADSISTAAFDERLGRPDAASRRIAVNTQHVLAEEAHLDKVVDPAGGSYYLERLTDELARAAWSLFQEIERRGGMAHGLGWVHEQVAETAARRCRDASRRKTPIIGVSEYPNLNEELPERAPAPVGPSAAAPSEPEGPAAFRPAAPYEKLRLASDRWAEEHGRRPRVFLAKIGGPTDYQARAGFASNFFAAGGIEPLGEGRFALVDSVASDVLASEVATAFEASGAEFVAVCSLDEIYAEHLPALAAALRECSPRAVVLAGRGGEHEAAFRGAGVDYFIFLGCDAVAVLKELWTALKESA